MGRYEAMTYFDKEVDKKLTWPVIFDDVKAGGEGEECDISSGKADTPEDSCHGQKEPSYEL